MYVEKTNTGWNESVKMSQKIKLCQKARFAGLTPDGTYLFFCAYENRNIEIYWINAKIIEELKPQNINAVNTLEKLT